MNLENYIRTRRASRPLYMPYLTIGDPDYDSTVEFATAMIDAGADIIELGIPFSDPTADGPVIQQAMVRSLKATPFSLDHIFEVAHKIHTARPQVPLVILTYANPLLSGYGTMEPFLEKCRASGVYGLVVPDLPHDQPEAIELYRLFDHYGVAQILLAAPTTTDRRLKEIAASARSFVYYVTSLGVTGERAELPADLADRLSEVSRVTGVPVFAGFGFSAPEQAAPLRHHVDGVIVGSLHHRIIAEAGSDHDSACRELKKSTSEFIKAISAE